MKVCRGEKNGTPRGERKLVISDWQRKGVNNTLGKKGGGGGNYAGPQSVKNVVGLFVKERAE